MEIWWNIKPESNPEREQGRVPDSSKMLKEWWIRSYNKPEWRCRDRHYNNWKSWGFLWSDGGNSILGQHRLSPGLMDRVGAHSIAGGEALACAQSWNG